MVGIAVAIIGFFAIAAILIKLIAGDMLGGGGGGGKRTNSNATPINLSNYRENANSLRGNIYQVDGKIEEMLKWTENGRLISFEASDGSKDVPVPILVPEEFQNVNLERGAEMTMVVRVNRDGTLEVEAIDN